MSCNYEWIAIIDRGMSIGGVIRAGDQVLHPRQDAARLQRVDEPGAAVHSRSPVAAGGVPTKWA